MEVGGDIVTEKEITIDCVMDFKASEELERKGKVDIMQCKVYEDGREVGYINYSMEISDDKFRMKIKTNVPGYVKLISGER